MATKPSTHDEVQFAEEDPSALNDLPSWRVLVVDDDPDVHGVTDLLLKDFRYKDRRLELLHTSSAAQGRVVLERETDIALILLDVVMETDDAGLQLARHVRQDLGNAMVRIVLRTGHPVAAPERSVISDYEIDGYQEKSDLTATRLYTLVLTALRTYEALNEVQAMRRLQAANQRLIAVNRELEHFAYASSHDLRAPLRHISSFSELLLRRCGDSLDEEGREFLQYIIHAARNMRDLLADLLELHRLGKDQAPREQVDCNVALDDALSNVQDMITERRAVVQRSPLPVIHGNHQFIVQLLQNLIENAIKYQPGDGPEVKISGSERDGKVILEVADRGVGIPTEDLERVFLPFQRLHANGDVSGTGVGLAICRKAVQFHDGAIWAESEPGTGTRMLVALPRVSDGRS